MNAISLRVVVTGASGFVGSALIATLRMRGHSVDAWSRHNEDFTFRLEDFRREEIAKRWCDRLANIDVLIHTAARVHQLNEKNPDAALYESLNADATRVLAEKAQAAGVKRFIFFSTAKVYGEGGSTPYAESMPPAPEGAYAQSKWRAEQLLQDSEMEIVILRPPLVYGPGVGGNFRRLWHLADSNWPLPLAQAANQRAMIALDNLLDITHICCEDARAAGHTFNVADAQAYSLAEIVGTVRRECGRRENLWRFPPRVLSWLIRQLRGSDEQQRLLGDFRMDIRNAHDVLDWQPRWLMADVVHQMKMKSSQ